MKKHRRHLFADGVDESSAIDGLAELIDSEFGEK